MNFGLNRKKKCLSADIIIPQVLDDNLQSTTFWSTTAVSQYKLPKWLTRSLYVGKLS